MKKKYKKGFTDILGNCFINDNGQLINIYSSLEDVNKEFYKLGIITDNVTIIDLFSNLFALSMAELSLTTDENNKVSVTRLTLSYKYSIITVLRNHLYLLSFYLCEYNPNLMSPDLKRIFEGLPDGDKNILKCKNKI
jgi:hypothetical protein